MLNQVLLQFFHSLDFLKLMALKIYFKNNKCDKINKESTIIHKTVYPGILEHS